MLPANSPTPIRYPGMKFMAAVQLILATITLVIVLAANQSRAIQMINIFVPLLYLITGIVSVVTWTRNNRVMDQHSSGNQTYKIPTPGVSVTVSAVLSLLAGLTLLVFLFDPDLGYKASLTHKALQSVRVPDVISTAYLFVCFAEGVVSSILSAITWHYVCSCHHNTNPIPMTIKMPTVPYQQRIEAEKPNADMNPEQIGNNRAWLNDYATIPVKSDEKKDNNETVQPNHPNKDQWLTITIPPPDYSDC